MAFIDALLRVCAAQAFTAVAVSTSSIDLTATTPQRMITTGEPVGFGISVGVAASATTVLFEAINATDALLTAGIIVLNQRTFLSADLPAGRQIWWGLPQNWAVAGALRFLGCRVTPAGGAATVTLTVDFTLQRMFSVSPIHYADAINV
jgi:hypothetical protein